MYLGKITLRLGVFMLLALPVVQCWAADDPQKDKVKKPAPAISDKKNADKKAAADKVAAEKAVDKKANALATPQAQSDTSTTEKPVHVLVVAVASDQLSLDVTTASSTVCDLNAACNIHLIVADNVVKDQLKQFHKGDHIQVVYSTDANKKLVLGHPASTRYLLIRCRDCGCCLGQRLCVFCCTSSSAALSRHN
jgi:hypothetical protein